MSAPWGRVLLIGNSRWHWAEATAATPLSSRESPAGTPAAAWRCWDAPASEAVSWRPSEIRAWAAVGPVPAELAAALPADRRLHTGQVPLPGAPTWLGVDRALVAWQAWCRQQRLAPGPVLVADAGTVLSLTLVSREGRFLGGRLLAGAALQWRAMAAGTAALPELAPAALDGEAADSAALADPAALWPQATAAAMAVGVIEGLVAAVVQAHDQARSLADPAAAAGSEACQGLDDLRLWVCGGDGPPLIPRLREAGVAVIEAPHLALEALIRLADPDLKPDGGAGPVLDPEIGPSFGFRSVQGPPFSSGPDR